VQLLTPRRVKKFVIIKEHTGAANTFDPIFARFFVDASVIPMLMFAAPGDFTLASGFNFSG